MTSGLRLRLRLPHLHERRIAEKFGSNAGNETLKLSEAAAGVCVEGVGWRKGGRGEGGCKTGDEHVT